MRYYSPTTNGWLSRDPLWFVDSTNIFAYVGNNPVNRIDPAGESGFGGVFFGRPFIFRAPGTCRPAPNQIANPKTPPRAPLPKAPPRQFPETGGDGGLDFPPGWKDLLMQLAAEQADFWSNLGTWLFGPKRPGDDACPTCEGWSGTCKRHPHVVYT